jgi:nitrous oxidase accessory protein
VTIDNVKISDFANGVLYYQSQGGEVSGNTFTSNANAVVFQVVKNSKILNNNFAGNSNGVTLFTTTNTAVNDNDFSKDSIAGITIGFGSTVTNVLRNEFSSDMLAILLNEGSTTATIKGNKVYATAAGDALKTGIKIVKSSGNTIYNNIFDTYNNVKATNTANVWSVAATGTNIVGGPSIGGNAWEMPNFAGFSQIMPDINADGFTDNTNSWPPVTATFFINNKNQDFLPLKV